MINGENFENLFLKNGIELIENNDYTINTFIENINEIISDFCIKNDIEIDYFNNGFPYLINEELNEVILNFKNKEYITDLKIYFEDNIGNL